MSKITLEPSSAGSGTFTIKSPSSNTNRNFLLPDEGGTVLTDAAAIPADVISGNLSTNTILPTGSILQMQTLRLDSQLAVSAPVGNSGTDITDLEISITPRKSNSLIHSQWFIQGEAHQDIGFRVRVDGSEVSDSYNTTVGNQRYNFILGGSVYDRNESSTPTFYTINFLHTPNSTSTVTYSPAVSSSNSNNRTLYINRTFSSPSRDSYESGVSWAFVYEIAQ